MGLAVTTVGPNLTGDSKCGTAAPLKQSYLAIIYMTLSIKDMDSYHL
jgi:hypothetical protein